MVCLFASCADELAELNKGYDTLTLTADKQEINLKEADASGYTLWNNSNQYYMLDALPPEQNLLSE